MLLTKEEIDRFARKHFEKRERYLALLSRNDPPLYIIEPDVLRDRARRFSRAFSKRFTDCRCYFAVKSNNHPVVSQTLLEEELGLDVSSGKELAMALGLGAKEILFTGPGKTGNEITLAVDNTEKVTVLIDSFRELQAIEQIAAAKKASVRAGVRLCTNTTGSWRKFGIALDDLPGFFEAAALCPHIDLQGLQFHTSWNLSPQAQCNFIGLLGKKLATCPASIINKIKFVDIGGGYWPPPGEWLRADPLVHHHHPAAAIETFATELNQAVENHLSFLLPCRLVLEPGRWICNDAMHLMMTVVDKKAPDLVITDAGINAIGWERFETDYFPILNLTRPSLQEKPCHICGSLCTPADNFGFSYFGEEIVEGDVLFIPCQGAYTYSLKQDFIKPAPQVVIMDGGEGDSG